ncbi:hypothetical protein [Chitinophaga sp. sic0106]|uniref:hypothetical protein n=1 Tax=Chitinophaga sp. sic0106 TaxID=2854785 RepID=UPI001C440AE5|nr:hypothetical protein [Chitinophaga sp. sic0106]MBV7533758.1 hypothetical protein [Chitinophaga sp. sic0106]
MAGENSIQVTISNGGIDLTAYLIKLQKQATETNRKLQDDGKAQNKLAQDQLKLINDQVDALTKLSNLEVAMARRRKDFYREQRQAETELQRIRSHQSLPGVAVSATNLSGVGQVDWSYTTSRQNLGLQAKGSSGGFDQFDTLVRAMHDNRDAISNAAQQQIAQFSNEAGSIVAAIDAVKEEIGKLGDLIPSEVECSCEGSDGGGSGGSSGGGDDELQRRYARRYPLAGLGKALTSTLANPETYTQLVSFAAKQYSVHANAENSFQTIKNDTEVAWGIGGGAVGALAGSLVGMPILGAQLGYTIGSTIGGAKGEQDQKKAIAQQEFEALVNRLNGFTGREFSVGVPRLSQYGVDAFQSAELMEKVATKGGMGEAARYTSELVSISKAYNVGQNELMGLIELQGTNKEGNNSLTALVSGLIDRGVSSKMIKSGDYAGLGDYFNKFATLHTQFLKNQTFVGTNTTADIMARFQQVGGMFSMSDPRGMSNAMAVQDGLSHPDSDVTKAMSFMALRKIAPNASMYELLEMQEQGLSGKKGNEYMQSIVKTAHTLGSDDDGRMFIKRFFPQLSYTASRELFDNSDAFNGVTKKGYLESMGLPIRDFDVLGKQNTTQMDRETAEHKDKAVAGMNEVAQVMSDKVYEALIRSLSGSSIKLENGTLEIGKSSASTLPSMPAMRKDNTLAPIAFKETMKFAPNPIH